MKYIIILFFLPFWSYAQTPDVRLKDEKMIWIRNGFADTMPYFVLYSNLPDTTILSYDIKKDTLFIYRESKTPHSGCLVNGCEQEWNVYKDRLIYVIRNQSLVLVGKSHPKYTEKTITKKETVSEEYW